MILGLIKFYLIDLNLKPHRKRTGNRARSVCGGENIALNKNICQMNVLYCWVVYFPSNDDDNLCAKCHALRMVFHLCHVKLPE